MTPVAPSLRRSAREVCVALGLYTVVFAVLAWPWLVAADHAVPLAGIVHPADERIVAWILGWVAHALVTAPQHVMDANINYPAPGQLAGIEHFLSTQLLFAPVFWATGNAVLAANVVVLLTYPLGALAMERLLVALGCRAAVAWVGGLLFALGPLRVPGTLMTLKYMNLHLALVALALTRLRQRRTLGRALVLAVAMTLALLSSYYLAVMALVVGGVWGVLEWFRRAPERWRFTRRALAATAVAFVPFVLVSLPYLQHADSSQVEVITSPATLLANAIAFRMYAISPGPLLIALALLGVAFVRSPHPAVRGTARVGLAIALAGLILMRGPQVRVGSWQVPLPFMLLSNTPARFFQAPHRFVVVFGFGLALLSAAALEALWLRLGRRVGWVALAAVATVVVVTQGARLAGERLDRLEGQSHPIYAAVAAVAGREGGALLGLPLVSLGAALKNPTMRAGSESDAMLGSTRHWLPLTTGETNHGPPHRKLLDDDIARLPASDALEEIVDMTHTRWVLLRPAAAWPPAEVAARTALLASPRLRRTLSLDGWELLRIEGEPHRAEWFAAIAAGPQAGRTVLGTRLEPIPEQAAKAEVQAMGALWSLAHADRPLPIALRVRNRGPVPWPVTLPLGVPPTHTVRLAVRWTPVNVRHGKTVGQQIPLRRDLASDDELSMSAMLSPPRQPGSYDLEIRVVQVEGARFDGPDNVPLRRRITLVAASP